MDYRRRIIDSTLDELQPHIRALALFGPKAVGKTATALGRVSTVVDLSVQDQREVMKADPDLLTSLRGPILVDEWQRLPEVWDTIRRAVDAGSEPGRFIIAGSSAPRGATIHSGAGRIVPMRMRPLSVSERDIETATVSLAALLNGEKQIEGSSSLTLGDYVEEITASGFPAIRELPRRLRNVELDAYLENIVQREFPEQGYQVRKSETLRGWLTAYAAATATTTTYAKILNAATPGQSDKPSKPATISYRDALSSLWLLDPVQPWLPTRNALERVGRTQKHMLADPALAARLLGLDADALIRGEQGKSQLREGVILGRLFETLVAVSIQTYAIAADAHVGHMRLQNSNREIDLIITRPDGKTLAIEVKLSTTVNDDDVKHLLWLREKMGTDVIDSMVINTGKYAYRRADGVAVVPLALLGA